MAFIEFIRILLEELKEANVEQIRKKVMEGGDNVICHIFTIALSQLSTTVLSQPCHHAGTVVPMRWQSLLIGRPYKASISLSHMAELASLGILQSPLGLIEILPTLGPSGKQERLNC